MATRTAPPAGEGTVKSADRVMAVLDLVAEVGDLGFAEIAGRLGLPKSSAHALLRTMERRRYLAYDADGKVYRLGYRIWELAGSRHEAEDLRTALKPLMDELSRRTEETVQLAVLDGAEAVYLALSESSHAVKLTSRAGSRLPAHTSAIGKTLLSGLDDEQVRARLGEGPLERLTEHTITDVDALLAELDRIRRQGYSVDNQEFAIGLRCVAKAVCDASGAPVAAMSVSMPTPRYSRAVATAARQELAATVEQAAARLGRRPG